MGFLKTIILLGAVQGFIISVLLFVSRRKRAANRFLSLLLLLISLASLNVYLLNINWTEGSQILSIISALTPKIIIMPIGPLIYFYIRNCIDPRFIFTPRHRRHFYPIIIDFVPQLIVLLYIIVKLAGSKVNEGAWGYFIDQYNVYSDVPRWVSVSIYLWVSYRYLAAPGTKRLVIRERQRENFIWLRQFLLVFLVFQAIWLLFLIPYMLPNYQDKLLDAVGWYPIYVPLAIMIYWLGIKGYIISFRQPPPARANPTPVAAPLAASLTEKVMAVLRKVMEEEKLYLNPALNLSLLAKHTDTPGKTLSAVLNQHLNKSFNEYINEYRVNEIKNRLIRDGHQQLTIAGLAYECGFNSQPTFQRAFKSIMGVSPREYLQKQAEEKEFSNPDLNRSGE